MSIHPTAVVSPEATIGRDVHIGPYSVIEGDAETTAGLTPTSRLHRRRRSVRVAGSISER